MLISCSENATKETVKEEKIATEKATEFGKQNYAVVWKWKTDDKELVDANLVDQANQLTELWKDGVIENAYFETQPTSNSFDNYPGISFFIKATTEENAKMILDEMIFVQKGISEYLLYPVGTRWLGRKEEAKQSGHKTWVSVWSTGVDHNSKASKKEVEDNAQAQTDAIMELWKTGVIENVYFDIEGTQTRNKVTDFVMFINANSESEARDVMNSLPFYKKNIAHYQLFSVGVFWMGEYESE
ncbi:MAG: hypothetical protein DRI54_05090 [Bacteroidetes bacterium]|nr:MAG: hypothetical protein DRI54_05090 [Bacteroidota bacterium]